MKKIFSMILGSSFAISVAYGDDIALQQNDQVSKKCHNNIYFGPEVFVFDLKTHFKGVKVDSTKFFIGLKLGYEYIKPKSFYFGTDLLAANGNKSFHESYKDNDFQKSNADTFFANLEFRFGRTFANEKRILIPFLGFGVYGFTDGTEHHYFEGGMSYFTGGVRYRREITPIFNVGLNLKVMVSDGTFDRFRFWHFKRCNHHGRWGGEIGIPLIWHLGSAKRWDMQLEPYFLKLDFSQVQNVYGTRLLFDYRF